MSKKCFEMREFVQDNFLNNVSIKEEEKLKENAKQLDINAMYKLAQKLENDYNLSEAYKIYEDAANKGHIGAMYRLGILDYRKAVCLFEIRDINVLHRALKWFEKAIEKGCADAMNAMGYYYHTVKKDYKKAVEFYEMGLKIKPKDEFLNGNYKELKFNIGMSK